MHTTALVWLIGYNQLSSTLQFGYIGYSIAHALQDVNHFFCCRKIENNVFFVHISTILLDISVTIGNKRECFGYIDEKNAGRKTSCV